MGKSDYEYLDEERKKLWLKVNSVETELNRRIDDELSKKASDYTDEAKQYSKKASEYKNRSEESKITISQYLEDARLKLVDINNVLASVETLNSNVTTYANDSTSNNILVKQIYDDIEKRKVEIEAQIAQLELIFEDHDSLVEKVEKLEETLTKSDDTSAKIETLYKSLLGRKKEIDQLYLDIFGYKEKDELSGKETIVDGLKDKLEKSYDEISQRMKKAEDGLTVLQNNAVDSFELFSVNNKTTFDNTISMWTSQYADLSKKIQELLPNALTAGLSSAYSEKKDAEILEYTKLNQAFNTAIWGLIVVSLIPFAIGIVSLYQGKALGKVMLDMPRLVLSILPLYVPVLWVAYSSNRKMNLSKRLSEEYSHKEVLSKTFEGLSTQINNITDVKVSYDLRNKLLYNILEVSSENPGKLISDYNKSDHPLMDALDKSVKLATAFERLEKIPGFSKLAKVMEKKSKAIIEDEDEKANKGIAVMVEEKE
jgi:hypothetical protein